MKRTIYIIGIILVGILALNSCNRQDSDGKAKYIFLFIGDGMSANQIAMTESWLSYKAGKTGGESLTMSEFPIYGVATTYTPEREITCSAAAGTAISCGSKTTKNRIATDADGNRLKSMSYELQEEGYNVALISSCPINHATEAAFFACEDTRNNFYEISQAIPSSGFQFFAGSGFIDFYGKGGDKESIVNYLERNGYTVCCGAEEYEAESKGCEKIVFYQECFRDKPATDYVMDGRRTEGEVPLPQMLEYGMDFIGDEKPFFIMCEGGSTDWAAHLNRTMPTINCIIEFDEAIKTAYKFYLQHPDETLIVVTADHGTGGVSLGCGGWGRDKIHWDIIEKAWTEAGMCNEMSLEENKELNESATIGWSGVYHTGEHVPVFAIGKGAERFSGKMDNTEFKSKILCIE